MGIVCDTPSPKFITKPVVRPEAYRDKIVWVTRYMACTLKISKMICVMRSRLALGVQKGVRGQNGMFSRRNPEFVVGRGMQDFLRIVPIREDTVLDKGAQNFDPVLAGGSAAIMEGACDPGGHPPGLAPRSPHS